ncbi:MAG TPA: COX15/CtaA family protein [Acidimicrobiia bacterium]|nr:COX15/CtaA family protein [Acidimicrobiia bacterium]
MTRIARFAWFTLVFNVGVIVFGGFVRASGSGAGCGRSWPACQGQLLPEFEGATRVEYLHRLSSVVAYVFVALLTVAVWRNMAKRHPARAGALVSLVSITVEALIGASIVFFEWVADDTSAARVVAVPLHLVNTLLLLAALTVTAFWLSGGRRLSPSSKPMMWRWVIVGGIALVLLAATGAVTALADTLFPKDGSGLEGSGEAHFLTDLRMVHPLLAIVAASIGWWASSRVEGPRPPTAKVLPALVGAMILTGSLNILLGVPVWMQLVHLLLADALWIAYVLASAQALQVPAEVNQPV